MACLSTGSVEFAGVFSKYGQAANSQKSCYAIEYATNGIVYGLPRQKSGALPTFGGVIYVMQRNLRDKTSR